MPPLPTLVQLLEAGLHFGHKRSRRHPKMEPFLFSSRSDITVIDVRKTLVYLEKALQAVFAIAEHGGILLFVGTKKQSIAAVKKYSAACEQPFVAHRWLGGTLTNFAVISKMIKKYHSLKEKQESGDLQKFTKKEQLDCTREIEELEMLIGGISKLTKLPDALFIVDINHDSTALKEAIRKNIQTIAICDANVNPELVTHPIPANDDAMKGIDLILSLVCEAYLEGKAKRALSKEVVAQTESKQAHEIVTQGVSL